MQKLLQLSLITLALSVCMPICRLKADTYTFNPTIVINNPQNLSSLDYTPSTFPSVSISIKGSAVQSGAFFATYSSNSAAFTGDYASLISFNIGDSISLTPFSGGLSTFRANLLFDANGSVSAGALFYGSDSFLIDLGGTAGLFQGAFASSTNGYQGFVSGTLTSVPEPTSFVVLAAGALGLTFMRRKSRGR